MVTHIYDIWSEIWSPTSAQNLEARKREILARFRTTSWLNCKYLRNATRHRQSENTVANCGHSCAG